MPVAYLTDLTHPAASALKERLEGMGYTVVGGGDFSTPAGVRAVMEQAGEAEALILTPHRGAGLLLSGSDGRMIARTGSETLFAAFEAARHFGARMAQRGRGAIVFLVSHHADKPAAADPAITIAQGAMVMMMKELALHLGHMGVRVNMVQLGPMAEQAEQFDSAISPADYDPESKTPLGRRAEGGDAAGAVAFLLSPDAAFVNGAVLRVDGGQTLYYFDRDWSFRREEEIPE